MLRNIVNLYSMNDDFIIVSIFNKIEYNYLSMRAINIFTICFFTVIYGCTTVEVAKEFTKATQSVQESIKKISGNENEESVINVEEVEEIKESSDYLLSEKREIKEDKKKEEIASLKQQKIQSYNFLNKTLNELTLEIGRPSLIRKDGKTQTVRFDTSNCRFFVYFDSTIKKPRSEYFEIRNLNGNLIDKKNSIKKCFKEIKNA